MKQIRAGLNSRAKRAAPHKRAAVYARRRCMSRGEVCKVLSSAPPISAAHAGFAGSRDRPRFATGRATPLQPT